MNQVFNSKSKKKKVAHITLFVFIILVAFLVRFMGSDFGLPLTLHPDEHFIVNPAVRIADGNLNPRWYGSPGSTLMYMNGFFFFVYTRAINLFSGPKSTQELFQQDPTPFYLIGRTFVILLSTFTVFLVFIIAKKIYKNIWSSYFSTIVIAVNYFHIKNSRFITPDVPTAFFDILILFFSLKILETKRLKYYLLAGASLGLATATKYPGVVGALVILFAHLFSLSGLPPKKQLKKFFFSKKIWLSAVISIVVFLIAVPFFLSNFSTVLKNVRHEARSVHLGADSLTFSGNLRWYLRKINNEGFGLFGSYILLVLFLLTLIRLRKKEILLIVFPISFLIFISTLGLHWERWIIPSIPFLALFLGGSFFYWVRKIRIKMVCILLALSFSYFLITPVFSRSVLVAYALTKEDTRNKVSEWRSRLDSSKKILTEGNALAKDGQVHKASIYDKVYWFEEFDYVVTSKDKINKYCWFQKSEKCRFFKGVIKNLSVIKSYVPARIKIPYLNRLPLIAIPKAVNYPGPDITVYQGMKNEYQIFDNKNFSHINKEEGKRSYDIGAKGDVKIVLLPSDKNSRIILEFADTEGIYIDIIGGEAVSYQKDKLDQHGIEVSVSGSPWYLLEVHNPKNTVLNEISFNNKTALALFGNIHLVGQGEERRIFLENLSHPLLGAALLKTVHKKDYQNVIADIDGRRTEIKLQEANSNKIIRYKDSAVLDLSIRDIIINSNSFIWLDKNSFEIFKSIASKSDKAY